MVDDEVERIVGRLSLEPASAARWGAVPDVDLERPDSIPFRPCWYLRLTQSFRMAQRNPASTRRGRQRIGFPQVSAGAIVIGVGSPSIRGGLVR
jgi:hypothetical protein